MGGRSALGIFGDSSLPDASTFSAFPTGLVNESVSPTGLTSVLPSIVGAFATGTDDTPGGETRYDEKGVEGYVPPGAQIIPNSTLQGLAQLTPDRLGSGGGTMNHTIKIDLTGANGDETIRQIAYAAANQGTLLAIASGKSDLKKSQARSGRDVTRF